MEQEKRGNFGSWLGVILASAGSAVGLGNIWRFPYQAGMNGGGAFLVTYIGCVLLLGIPIMVAEFMIGRHSHANTASAYRLIAPHRHFGFVGVLAVAAGTLILCYYAVVAGWTLDYLLQAVTGAFGRMARQGGAAAFQQYFDGFVASPVRPVVCLAVFMLISHWVIVRGVKRGIERSSKVLMPMLFVLVLVLVGCAMTLPGRDAGLRFFLQPDFSKITSGVVLSAMAQAFYSLSLGMGCLCTYASYFKNSTNLLRTAGSVGLIDTLIAMLAGLIIFPTVFSVPGLVPNQGPSLVFIALPNVFQQAMGGMPVVAYLCSVMFYALLVVATLTSVISLHEVGTAYLMETRHLSRARAAGCITAFCIVVGTLCSLSLGVLSGWRPWGMSLFDLFDFVTAKLMLPASGLLTAVLVGWLLNRRLVWSELTNRGTLHVGRGLLAALMVCLRFVAPVSIVLIFLNQLGLIDLF